VEISLSLFFDVFQLLSGSVGSQNDEVGHEQAEDQKPDFEQTELKHEREMLAHGRFDV
jgi:hypothetical protein